MNKEFLDWLLEKDCYPMMNKGFMLLEAHKLKFGPVGIKQVKYRINE